MFLAAMLLAIAQKQNAIAQQILGNGELLINLLNASIDWNIYVDAVSTTWGSKNQNYPVLTSRYLHYHLSYGNIPNFDAIDDQNSAPSGQVIAYGRYKIKIEGNSVYVDYRDCGYYGVGDIHYDAGRGHDITVTYDFNTHSFIYMNPSSGNIWDNRNDAPNRSIDLFKIPVTATNNFSGGKICMSFGGNLMEYYTPHTIDYGWTTTNTINAISPQIVDGMVYTFTGWDDGVGGTIRSVTIDDQHNSYNFQADFSSKPQTPQNFSGTTENNHPKLTWTANTGSSVSGYWIYRNYDKQGFEHCATVTPNTDNSWIDYAVYTHQRDKLIAYRIDCFDNTSQHSDPTRSVYYWGDMLAKKRRTRAEGKLSFPINFALFANYPNPFNPTTIIRYRLPEAAHVTLAIYNLQGRLVETLVNGEKEAGSYSVQWHAESLPSGVYFYRIQTGQFTATKKLLLLK